MAKAPLINDITTTTDAPPQFFAAPAASKQYKMSLTPIIKKHYGDLAPVVMIGNAPDVVQKIIEVFQNLGFQNIQESASSSAVQAVDITKVLRFRDDVICEVRMNEQDEPVVHIRSTSRLGRGDFGANAQRIRTIINAFAFRVMQRI